MSKKHFEWAAAYVRKLRWERDAIRPDLRDAMEVPAPGQVEDAFVALFGAFGPRFDEARFRAACRVPA